MAPFPLGATKIADQSWAGPSEGPEALKQFQQYKTRLRHYVNDGQDLKEPADQKMLWAFMWKNAPEDMAAFITDAPLMLLADDLLRLMGPTEKSHAREGLYYCRKSYPRLCMCIAPVANRSYWQVHMLELNDTNFENGFWGHAAIRGRSSGVYLDYGRSSQSTVLILRNSERGEMQYWLPRQTTNTIVSLTGRSTSVERYAHSIEEHVFERFENDQVKNFFDKMKW